MNKLAPLESRISLLQPPLERRIVRTSRHTVDNRKVIIFILIMYNIN